LLLYLLDANVLIDAKNLYYPFKRVPEFWTWLEQMGRNGFAKIPIEIYEELKNGKDELSEWVKKTETQTALLFSEEVNIENVRFTVNEGYAPDLTDDEQEKLGRDPFLIAYALTSKQNRTIVTTEATKPNRKRANRRIPDVCNNLEILWCTSFIFFRDLDFSTDWKTRISET